MMGVRPCANAALTRFQTGKVIIDRNADFFHRLGADPGDGLQLLGGHVRERLDRGHPRLFQFLDEAFAHLGDILDRGGCGADQRAHLLLDFLALLFLALDVDLPAQQLGRQPDILPLLADGQRELAVVHDHFQVLVAGIEHGDAADLGGLQCLLRKRDRVPVVFDDVDFLAAQFADARGPGCARFLAARRALRGVPARSRLVPPH